MESRRKEATSEDLTVTESTEAEDTDLIYTSLLTSYTLGFQCQIMAMQISSSALMQWYNSVSGVS